MTRRTALNDWHMLYRRGAHCAPCNAISNVFSGAHGAPLRLGKAQMSYKRCDESSHPTVKCVDKYNSQAPCMITRHVNCEYFTKQTQA